MQQYTRDDLIRLVPRFDAFIGMDSDGCVFDSMAVKQRDFFHPLIIRYWNLERIAEAVRETAEFVNLRSVWRGQNRFRALLKTFELLDERTDVHESGVALPNTAVILAYVESGLALGNPTLEIAARNGQIELRRMLDWSLAVNHDIALHMGKIPAFAGALTALDRVRRSADVIVVSQTPETALLSEWRQHGIADSVRLIAGQELGSKAEHLELAAKGKYPDDRILLIGDAPGDREAALQAGVAFYPIVPDAEEDSWARFNDEALDVFLSGRFRGEYEQALIREFMEALPTRPPWL